MEPNAAPRVLIIEDIALVARSFKLVLRAHQPVVAPSLDALTGVLGSIAPGGVVLSDLGLDDGGADEIHALIEAERPDLLERLFWLTGGGSNLDRYHHTIEKSGRPVVLKPIAPLELRALVEGALLDENEGG